MRPVRCAASEEDKSGGEPPQGVASEEDKKGSGGEAGGGVQSGEKKGESTVTSDIIAGISTACVAIPQSCGYALLAGTGVECAFMAAAASSIPSAILGSSRYMHVGCISLASLLTFGALSNLGLVPGSAAFVAGAGALAFYTGVTRLVVGFARLGNLVTSLPKAALEGFVVAAVWMVFSSQTPAMLGAKCVGPMSAHFATAAMWLMSHPAVWHPGTALFAACTFIVMLNGTKIHKMFPSALLCCLVSGAAVFMGFDAGTTVGAISLDLGHLAAPPALSLSKEMARALIVPGIAIGITTYLEGAAVCNRWADEDGEVWDSNKELIAQGVSNLASAAVGGMPVSGVISRAAFGKTSGAKTRLAHGVTGAMIIAFLVSGGGVLLGFLPKAVLGALVGCGVLPLMRPTAIMTPLLHPVKEFATLSYELKRDCLLAWATVAFTVTSVPAMDMGLIKGCILALAVHLAERAGLLNKSPAASAPGGSAGDGGAEMVPGGR